MRCTHLYYYCVFVMGACMVLRLLWGMGIYVLLFGALVLGHGGIPALFCYDYYVMIVMCCDCMCVIIAVMLRPYWGHVLL